MPDYGKQIHAIVYPPFRHPMTGEVLRLQCNYTDRIITKEEALKLNRHYNRKAAQGSMPMSGL